MAPEPPGATPVRVRVERVSKEFIRAGGATVQALDDVSLEVHENEITVLLGPSGCGKSTLLRSIAGLEHPTSGVIQVAGQTVFEGATGISMAPEQRDVSMMFQSYALWPHMTLEANVAYPLRVRGVRRGSARARAKEYLDLVGLGGLGQQYAGSVSGGQAQRAALARTLIAEPAVVLFDEPLSNVDAKVRSRLRGELLRIHREVGFSAVYVTHDQIEAMGVAHRVAVMRDGQILQVDDPQSVYERPSTRYTGEFIGEANFLEGEVVDGAAGQVGVRTPLGTLKVPRLAFEAAGVQTRTGIGVTLMIRPEHVGVRAEDPTTVPSDGPVGEVKTALYAGSRTEYLCVVDGHTVQAWQLAGGHRYSPGTRVRLEFAVGAIHLVKD